MMVYNLKSYIFPMIIKREWEKGRERESVYCVTEHEQNRQSGPAGFRAKPCEKHGGSSAVL